MNDSLIKNHQLNHRAVVAHNNHDRRFIVTLISDSADCSLNVEKAAKHKNILRVEHHIHLKFVARTCKTDCVHCGLQRPNIYECLNCCYKQLIRKA